MSRQSIVVIPVKRNETDPTTFVPQDSHQHGTQTISQDIFIAARTNQSRPTRSISLLLSQK
jgi:hypothetical protein